MSSAPTSLLSDFSLCQRMLLGIAIGDAFGAGYEFMSGGREAVGRALDFERYASFRDADHFIPPGMYTDDAQMSVGVCLALLSGEEFSPLNLADKFVSCFKRDPIQGYAGRFRKFLGQVQSGNEFLEKIKPDSSLNGAAMRSVPLGLEPDVERVIHLAKINASLTHNTLVGIASATAVALASHYFIYSGAEAGGVFDFIDSHIRGIDPESARHFSNIREMKTEAPKILCGEGDANSGIPSNGMLTAGAVLYLVTSCPDLSDLLRAAVLLGGDTDSVASISLGISAVRRPLSELPEFLLSGLTNHLYGRDYLIGLGSELQKKYFGYPGAEVVPRRPSLI